MKRCAGILILIAFVMLCLVGCGGDPGIWGKVIDGDGNPVVGAEVTLLPAEDDSAGGELVNNTDEEGKFFFPDQPSGQYTLGVTWTDAPRCPVTGLNLGRSGDWVIAYKGDVFSHVLIATNTFGFVEGRSLQQNLELTCP